MAWSAETLAFDRSDAKDSFRSKDARSGASTLLEPEVRVNFADTALWLPALTLDANGKAETEIRFPQSLTTWRLHGYALTKSTQVGDATNEVTTTKNLLVRLEVPRFFVERDEVVLSANVHNYLKQDKKVQVELLLPADLFDGESRAGVSPARRAVGKGRRDACPTLGFMESPAGPPARLGWSPACPRVTS